MSSTTETDPFLQVQSDVLAQLSTTRPLFTSYLRIRSLSSPTRPSPELISARADLTDALSTLTEDLFDLRAAIAALSADPYKYGLEIEEVARRKRVVDEVGGEVEDMQEELGKGSSNFSGHNGNTHTHTSAGASANGGMEHPDRFEESDAEPDYNAEFEHQQQLHMMAEQDTQLDSVFRTVGNIRAQADDMGRELEEQGHMLDEVDTLADRVGGRLQGGLKTMGTVIRKNEDGLSSCCIGVLILVLIILLVLVLVI